MLRKLGWKVCAVAGLAILVLVAVLSARVLRRDKIASNESAAIGALRAYLSAQNQFKRSDSYKTGSLVYANTRDGAGFPDLYQIGGPGSDGKVLRLIDRNLLRRPSLCVSDH